MVGKFFLFVHISFSLKKGLMIAIILAGGKSSRIGIGKEKAIIEIEEVGKLLIDLVIERVRESKVDDFAVAISKNTPKTKEYCKFVNYAMIETSGKNYHEDLQYLLQLYPQFVSIACDIPFLRSEHIDAIVDFYDSISNKNSITGTVPLDIIPSGVVPAHVFEYKGKKLISCGINVVTNSKNSLPLVFNDPLLAININTPHDLEMAKSIFDETREKKRYEMKFINRSNDIKSK